MKRNALNIMLLASALAAPAAAALPAGDKVFAAMRDEMSRSMDKLDLDGLGKPCFMAYRVQTGHTFSVSASFGGLERDYSADFRRLGVDLRVGTYSFDSSHYASDIWNGYHTAVDNSAPLEDDYGALRFDLWSLTDGAYKKALETYSKKKAFVESKNITDLYPDISTEPVHELYLPAPVERLDEALWKENARKVSAVFRKYPAVRYSAVGLDFTSGNERFLNSEGSAYRQPLCGGSVSIDAVGFAPDGFRLHSSYSESFCDAKDAPPLDRLISKAEEMGRKMTEQDKSGTLKAYIGPVLFERQAAAAFFSSLLVSNVSSPREIWTDPNRWYGDGVYRRAGRLVERLGMRVMSPFLNVVDDPLASYYDGRPMTGHYLADNEGVPARRLELVRRGKLVAYYMSRAATRDFTVSNGHGLGALDEYPDGSPSNVFIDPDGNPSKVLSDEALKKRFLDLCKDEELDYCVRVDSLNGLYGPFMAWKVYLDGREEPVHGIEFTEVTLRALRDIVAVSKKRGVYDLDWTTGGSIVTPSILVQEMEIKKSERKPDKLPYLPNPYFSD